VRSRVGCWGRRRGGGGCRGWSCGGRRVAGGRVLPGAGAGDLGVFFERVQEDAGVGWRRGLLCHVLEERVFDVVKAGLGALDDLNDVEAAGGLYDGELVGLEGLGGVPDLGAEAPAAVVVVLAAGFAGVGVFAVARGEVGEVGAFVEFGEELFGAGAGHLRELVFEASALDVVISGREEDVADDALVSGGDEGALVELDDPVAAGGVDGGRDGAGLHGFECDGDLITESAATEGAQVPSPALGGDVVAEALGDVSEGFACGEFFLDLFEAGLGGLLSLLVGAVVGGPAGSGVDEDGAALELDAFGDFCDFGDVEAAVALDEAAGLAGAELFDGLVEGVAEATLPGGAQEAALGGGEVVRVLKGECFEVAVVAELDEELLAEGLELLFDAGEIGLILLAGIELGVEHLAADEDVAEAQLEALFPVLLLKLALDRGGVGGAGLFDELVQHELAPGAGVELAAPALEAGPVLAQCVLEGDLVAAEAGGAELVHFLLDELVDLGLWDRDAEGGGVLLDELVFEEGLQVGGAVALKERGLVVLLGVGVVVDRQDRRVWGLGHRDIPVGLRAASHPDGAGGHHQEKQGLRTHEKAPPGDQGRLCLHEVKGASKRRGRARAPLRPGLPPRPPPPRCRGGRRHPSGWLL
jgi:hypothetical protein